MICSPPVDWNKWIFSLRGHIEPPLILYGSRPAYASILGRRLDDEVVKAIGYRSFYLGSDMYVAPVLEPGATGVKVHFPGKNKTFTHVWYRKKYHTGQTARVSAPYGKPTISVVGTPNTGGLDDFLQFVRQENSTTIHF